MKLISFIVGGRPSFGAVKDNDFASITIDTTYPAEKGEGGMGPALDCLCAEAEEYVRAKEINIIILSDRRAGPNRIVQRRRR